MSDVATARSSAAASPGAASATAGGQRLGDSAPLTLGASATGLPTPPTGTLSDPAGAQEVDEPAPTAVAAASAAQATPVTASLPDDTDPRQGELRSSAIGDTAAPAASTPTGGTAYPLAAPGTLPVGGAPVTPVDGRPAQAALPPQAQVLNAVSPLLTTADGTHRLTVHLAPAHLGSVQVHIEVAGGEVTVRLTAADPATCDALRHGAAELRSHLERLGLRSGGIEVQVAPGDPARDLVGRTLADPASTGHGDRGSGQRDPGPWAGPETAGGRGDAPPDGAWHRHERPLEGWAPRDPDSGRPRGAPAAASEPDPHRPPLHDVRVDVRM